MEKAPSKMFGRVLNTPLDQTSHLLTLERIFARRNHNLGKTSTIKLFLWKIYAACWKCLMFISINMTFTQTKSSCFFVEVEILGNRLKSVKFWTIEEISSGIRCNEVYLVNNYWLFKDWCPLKDHTYLNKPEPKRCWFV